MSHQATLLPIGEPFIELPTVDSTNNYAMAQVRKGVAKHGAAFFAHDQTAGKGQRGKSWTTTPGESIILSIVCVPGRLKPVQSFHLSASMALACYYFFKNYAGEETAIKWPNDIYWRDRKAAGILIENVIQQDHWSHSIVGIGVNVNQHIFNSDLPNPVSLKQVTGRSFDPVSLAKELCTMLQTHYQKLQLEPDTVISKYNEYLYRKNQSIKLRKGNIVFETILKEVSPSGTLMTKDGLEREFDFGEVEWIL